MLITSTQNPRIKAAARLRDARARAKQGRIVIDGVREIGRALDGGVQVREAFICAALCDSPAAKTLRARLESAHVEILETTPEVFAKLAYGERGEGIVAVADRPERSLREVRLPELPLVCVVEGVEKPGNLGAILRSADGAGVSAVVVADSGVDLYNPNVIRASLGTVFTMPLCAVSTADAIAWLRGQKFTIFAARVEAAHDYAGCDFRKPCAIVLGSEAKGLTESWHADDITPISLPMRGIADSLNLSATAAVLFYEALRQRSR